MHGVRHVEAMASRAVVVRAAVSGVSSRRSSTQCKMSLAEDSRRRPALLCSANCPASASEEIAARSQKVKAGLDSAESLRLGFWVSMSKSEQGNAHEH